MYAECLFRDEIVRRMALLKVHDDSIFKQVKQEIEVDFAQQIGDLDHDINDATESGNQAQREVRSYFIASRQKGLEL